MLCELLCAAALSSTVPVINFPKGLTAWDRRDGYNAIQIQPEQKKHGSQDAYIDGLYHFQMKKINGKTSRSIGIDKKFVFSQLDFNPKANELKKVSLYLNTYYMDRNEQ